MEPSLDLAAGERRQWLPPVDVTRRGFVVTTLATGFALSVRPSAAQETITTDTDGLVAGEVKVPVRDGEMPAYRARPDKPGRFPVVIVVQEIFGVHEHIKDICRRLAKVGYLAVAPELYARQGDVSQIADIRTLIDTVVSKVPDAQVMEDLDETLVWADKSGEGDADRAAVTGFCWGGRIVWLYAAHNPKLKAGVAWYGRLVGEPDELHQKHPVDVAADLHAPVLGLYGEADSGIPLDSIEQMRRAVADAGKQAEIVVYPAAPHGFHADYRPSYREADAKDGWERLKKFFADHGV